MIFSTDRSSELGFRSADRRAYSLAQSSSVRVGGLVRATRKTDFPPTADVRTGRVYSRCATLFTLFSLHRLFPSSSLLVSGSRGVASQRRLVVKTVGGEFRFTAGSPVDNVRPGVGFQLNMIDEETLLSLSIFLPLRPRIPASKRQERRRAINIFSPAICLDEAVRALF